MKTLAPLLSLILLVTCTSKEAPEHDLKKVDEFLSLYAKHFDFNGNVLLAEQGKVIYKKSFGLADYNKALPLNDSSVFELASVTKQFTALAILQLHEKGKLQLTDTLRKFFPELPYSGITIHHMLTHTSGLPDYFPLVVDRWDHTHIAFNKDVIALLAKENPPLNFTPGSRWEYSNTAFMLLASIIEKVSGQTWKDYMALHVFEPLGMRHTRVYNTRRSGETIPNYAFGFVWSDSLQSYHLPDSLKEYQMVYYMDGIQGDGVVNSTTTDLLTWNNALKENKLVTKETMALMLKRHALVDTLRQAYYGYGIGSGKDEVGAFFSHNGGWPGYSTYLARYPATDLTVVVLSNNQSASNGIGKALAYLVAGKAVVMPQPLIANDAPINKQAWQGQYKGEEWTFNIEEAGSELVYHIPKYNYKATLHNAGDNKIFMNPRSNWYLERVAEDSAARIYEVRDGLRQAVKKIR